MPACTTMSRTSDARYPVDPRSRARPAGTTGRRDGPTEVALKRKALEAYRAIVGDDVVEDIRDLATELRGARILELSSTATGGGVAEMLASLVPLERDVGLDAQWRVIAGDGSFFETTKMLHNGLQGMAVGLTDQEFAGYLDHNRAQAAQLEGGWDAVIVHDPQPAPIASFAPDLSRRWIWRCHIDSSDPDPAVWDRLRPYVEHHDRAVFTMDAFVPADLGIPVSLITPAIDPLSSKNRELPRYLAAETVAELGIDLSRPLLLQVSRFDPWKDPLGVVAVWRNVRETFPALQLALVGSMAGDDPEGWRVYRELEHEIRSEEGCFLLSNQMGVTGHEVNSLQRVADVAIQKSIREGFGLIVSETLWKGTAMVAGRAGGIPLQITDGVNGYLAGTVEEFGDRVTSLLKDPGTARRLGTAGRRAVRERYLLPRLLRDQLRLLRELLGSGA
jgi:trehalose synthase